MDATAATAVVEKDAQRAPRVIAPRQLIGQAIFLGVPPSLLRARGVPLSSFPDCGESPTANERMMALHRDIFWLGRQWAVTGFGIQACNQKQKGKFDIEGARLWEDGVLESLRSEKWLNVEDFEKAIEVARKYYPEPPRKPAPHKTTVAGAIEKASKEPVLIEPSSRHDLVAAPKPAVQEFSMRVTGWPAKFQPLWRIRR